MASSIFSSALGLLPVQTNTLPVNAPPSVFVRYAAVSHPTGSYTTAAAAMCVSRLAGGERKGGPSSQEHHSWSAATTTQSAASSAGQ